MKKITVLWRVKLKYIFDDKIQTSINNYFIEHKVNSLQPEVTIYDVVIFIHKTLNIPTKSTLIKAIENVQLITLSTMKTSYVLKHLQKS